MDGEEIFCVEPADQGQRLDLYLTAVLDGTSRSRVQSVIRDGKVLLNGAVARPRDVVQAGDEVAWQPPPPAPCETATAEDIPLDILFEDEHLLVLHKPAGMVVHPGAGNFTGTLVSALLHHCGELSSVGGVQRPGIVHRLDKETSGCLVVAKTDASHQSLSEQFAGREVKKVYLAVTVGAPRYRTGKVDAPIERHPAHRQKMRVAQEARGREATTEYNVLTSHAGASLIECRPRTGRTHQIRVHLKHLGCPIQGDILYGKRGDFTRHMLHAWKLEFRHPVTGETLSFVAPPPPEFTAGFPGFQFAPGA